MSDSGFKFGWRQTVRVRSTGRVSTVISRWFTSHGDAMYRLVLGYEFFEDELEEYRTP